MSLRSRAERLARDVAEARRVLGTLDEHAIYDLLRRHQFSATPDGYPSSTRPSEGRGHGADDPLLSVVVARSETHEADPLRQHIEEVLATLAEISGHARRVERLCQVVVHAGDKLKGRAPQISQCQACGRDVAGTEKDRLRAGYCDACRHAWTRAGRPDRALWEIQRRRELDEVAEA